MTPTETMKVLGIWFTVIRQRRPQLLRDLWTRRGEHFDREKEGAAVRELAHELSQRIETAKLELYRQETGQDHIWQELDEKQLKLPRL